MGMLSSLLIFNELVVKNDYIFKIGMVGLKLYLFCAIFTFFIIWNIEKVRLWLLVVWLIIYQILAYTSLLIYPTYRAVVYWSGVTIVVVFILRYVLSKIVVYQDNAPLTMVGFCNYCQLIIGIILVITNLTLLTITPMTSYMGILDSILPLVNIIGIVCCRVNKKSRIIFIWILIISTIIYVSLHFRSAMIMLSALTGVYLVSFIPNKGRAVVRTKNGILLISLLFFILWIKL